MKIDKSNCNCAGIYVIKNLVNGKIYVGKSKNCYRRLHLHLYDIKTPERNYNENPHLLNAFNKYGADNFGYYIVEKIENEDVILLEKILAERELYWMIELDSLNREKGYNLRYDSQGKCYCAQETSEKITNRLKKEWAEGTRDGHSEKMKNYWKNNTKRKEQQSKLFTQYKTKYKYIIYDPEGNLITEEGTYLMLKELKLLNVFSEYNRKKKNDIIFKGYRIIRINCKDIVHTESKDLEELK